MNASFGKGYIIKGTLRVIKKVKVGLIKAKLFSGQKVEDKDCVNEG